MPGLDPQGVADQMHSSWGPGTSARFSILALGINSLISVLILFEIARLLSPRLATWLADSPKGAGWIAIAIGSLALGIAALDAINLYTAFGYSGLLMSQAGEIPLHGVASLVAGVALLIWFADAFRLRALVFSGFWIVLTMPVLAGLPYAIWQWAMFLRTGAVAWAEFLVPLILLIVGPLPLVFSADALRNNVARGGGNPLVWSVLLVWPPFVAGSLSRFVALIAAESGSTLFGIPFHVAFSVAWSGTMALMLPLVMLLYVRMTRRAFPQGADWVGKRVVLGVLVLAQLGICVALELTTLRWPIPLHGASVIALVIVSWALVHGLRPAATERAGRPERDAPYVPNVADRPWLEPWEPLGSSPADLRLRKQWEAELSRELAPDHVLTAQLPVTMIARRFDREDALFQLEDGRVALVELTWSQAREAEPRLPQTTIHDTLDTWFSTHMRSDHADWSARRNGPFLDHGAHPTAPQSDKRE